MAANDRRLNLDEIDARVQQEIEREREEARAIMKSVQPTTDADLALREENDKLRAMLNQVIDARQGAREFMTIWSDPRKLPELVQEIYNSHPNVRALQVTLGSERAGRVARLMGHMALTYEIHPLIPGMFYAWEQGGNVIVEIGYRGYGEMLKREGIDYDTRAMTEAEREEHGLKDGDCGWICEVYDWARIDRFLARGMSAPAPYRGIGIWTKGSNKPLTKSGDWVAEKNAGKDGARKVLSFAVNKTAQIDTSAIDFTYSAEDGAWVMPVDVADWLTVPGMADRFADLLSSMGVTDEAFSDYIGHNWRYTNMPAHEAKEQAEACAQWLAAQTPHQRESITDLPDSDDLPLWVPTEGETEQLIKEAAQFWGTSNSRATCQRLSNALGLSKVAKTRIELESLICQQYHGDYGTATQAYTLYEEN